MRLIRKFLGPSYLSTYRIHGDIAPSSSRILRVISGGITVLIGLVIWVNFVVISPVDGIVVEVSEGADTVLEDVAISCADDIVSFFDRQTFDCWIFVKKKAGHFSCSATVV